MSRFKNFEEFLLLFPEKPRQKIAGGFNVRCPAHNDQDPSLSVVDGKDKILVKCQSGCTTPAVCAALNIETSDLFYATQEEEEKGKPGPKPRGEVERTYDYLDAGGKLLFQVVRYIPKSFRQHQPDGKGGWTWNLHGVQLVLYRLPDVLKAIAAGTPVYLVEGEKDADNLAALGLTATTCPMGAGKWRQSYTDTLKGANVILLQDNDSAGKKHVELVSKALSGQAASLRALPPFDVKDVSDWLAAGHTRGELESLVEATQEYQRLQPSQPNTEAPEIRKLPYSSDYTVDNGCHCLVRYNRETKSDDTISLCNFVAHITDDFLKDDGQEQRRFLRIAGKTWNNQELVPVDVDAGKFLGMNWMLEQWGTRVGLRPGNTIKDHVRAAIETESSIIRTRHIYTHTGWLERNGGDRVFLTEGGAIGDSSIIVQQDDRLRGYNIPQPVIDAAKAFNGSLEFLSVADESITIPLWASMYLAPLSSALNPAFTMWCVGPSGSFKSTISALALCHFGYFNYKQLPGSWDATGNRLEYLLFLAKDVPLIIDDWAPGADLSNQHQLEQKVSRLVHNVGNRQGRGRMAGSGVAQKDYMPRGLLISSGEQLPGGHSDTARYFPVAFSRELVNMEQLSLEQRNTDTYRAAMYYYLSWLREAWQDLVPDMTRHLQVFRDKARDAQPDGIHSRLPEEVAALYIGFLSGLNAAVHYGAMDQVQADELASRGWEVLIRISAEQAKLIEEERPAEKFIEGLRTLLGSRIAIIRDRNSLIEEIPPGQTLIGWTDENRPEFLYLNAGMAYKVVHQYYAQSGRPFTFNATAVYKDLERQGYLAIIGDRSPADKHKTSRVEWINNQAQRVVCLKRETIEQQQQQQLPLGEKK